MKKFFMLERKSELQKGSYSAAYKWGLPGVTCPKCKATWAGAGLNYPVVDLSDLPVAPTLTRAYLEENFGEYERLRDAVRPLLPPQAPLEPGAAFGPLVGTARGPFSAFVHQYGDILLVRPDTLEHLHAAGLRGLRGCRTELRYRRKSDPELLDLHIEPRGLLHLGGISPDKAVPCSKCGRLGFALPDPPVLDAASIPEDLDLFRLAHFGTVLVVTERFKTTVQRLALDGLSFRELALR